MALSGNSFCLPGLLHTPGVAVCFFAESRISTFTLLSWGRDQRFFRNFGLLAPEWDYGGTLSCGTESLTVVVAFFLR